MKRPQRLQLDTIEASPRSELDHLLSWIDVAAHTWLPPRPRPTLTLSEAIAAATPAWPEQQQHPAAAAERTLLFPLAYHGIPQLTAGLFHQLVDACCEAQRANARVLLAAIPIGRSETSCGAARIIDSIAELFRTHGWDVWSAGDLCNLDGLGKHLTTRARTTSYTRRAIDLPDMLTAAACDATATDWVYLADGTMPGRHLHRFCATAPLGRLHTPGQPFAPPPPAAKRVPAGTDQVWSAALTLGLTDKVGIGLHRHEHMQADVKAKLGPLWKKLTSAGFTRHYGVVSDEPRRLTLTGPAHDTMVIPLFGAPRTSAATDALIAAAAATCTTELVVDDVTPRVFYTAYRPDDVRSAFTRLATSHRCTATFLSELDPAELTARITSMLDLFTVGDLIEASPPGRVNRSRGSFTGYDAIHLAVMAVASTIRHGAALAAQAHNVPALKVIARRYGDTALLSRSGPPGAIHDHELRIDPAWLSKPFRGYP